MALRLERGDRDGITDGQRRHQRFALLPVGGVLVAGLHVDGAVAGERDRRAGGGELGVGAVRRQTHQPHRDRRAVTSAICDASVRCQISRYSDRSWPLSSPASCCGERSGVVGRIASWASWAFFTLEVVLLGLRRQVPLAVLGGDGGAHGLHRLGGQGRRCRCACT